jgi:hypothetical protein
MTFVLPSITFVKRVRIFSLLRRSFVGLQTMIRVSGKLQCPPSLLSHMRANDPHPDATTLSDAPEPIDHRVVGPEQGVVGRPRALPRRTPDPRRVTSCASLPSCWRSLQSSAHRGPPRPLRDRASPEVFPACGMSQSAVRLCVRTERSSSTTAAPRLRPAPAAPTRRSMGRHVVKARTAICLACSKWATAGHVCRRSDCRSQNGEQLPRTHRLISVHPGRAPTRRRARWSPCRTRSLSPPDSGLPPP